MGILTTRTGNDHASRHDRLKGRLPLLTAVVFGLAAVLAIGLAAAAPARAASPTLPPFTSGRHVYDYGKVLSAKSATAADALATHIEAAGGGRVAIYTTKVASNLPDETKLAAAWKVDGILITDSGDYGQMKMGTTLTAKLTKDQNSAIETSPGMSTSESWILSSLARIDGFVSGTHVFDGAGLFDAATKQKAEAAAKDLGNKIGGQVYVDIALGGDDSESVAFFNGAGLSSHLGTKALVIAFGVSPTQIGGYIDSTSDLWDSYHTVAPWKSDILSNETDTDIAGTVMTRIGSVTSGSLANSMIMGDILPWIIFAIVIVIFSITAPFVWGPWLMRKLTGAAMPIKNGIPTTAVIQSIGDTGITITSPDTGPEAPEYKLGLLVTPAGGMGSPYPVDIKAIIPRIFVPMVVPGATIGVLIDPADPQKVSPDWKNFNGGAAVAGGGMAPPWANAVAAAAGAAAPGGMDLNFDAAGNPNMNQLGAFASAVSAGQLPTHSGSAAQLLATGTHGTAVITTVMPLGKTVRQVNPNADPATLDDPIWMFTVEATLAGQAPFPAVFGHRVPTDKLALLGPGTKLSVAVNEADKNQEVAIDWTKSPITG